MGLRNSRFRARKFGVIFNYLTLIITSVSLSYVLGIPLFNCLESMSNKSYRQLESAGNKGRMKKAAKEVINKMSNRRNIKAKL